jgi:hypothetical protein
MIGLRHDAVFWGIAILLIIAATLTALLITPWTKIRAR